MMILTWWISKKRGYLPSRSKKATRNTFLKALIEAIPALLVPFGLLLGLRLGWFTPTEAGAICVLYSLIIGFFFYREIKISDIPKIIKESVINTAGVMFILAGAQAFSGYLTWERLPNTISEALISGISSPFIFLMVVNILLIIVGMFFDGGAAMILLAPLLVPAATALGVDLIHFGIVLSINLTIAGMTPPLSIDDEVYRTLSNLEWQGNIRQLRNFCERLVVLYNGKTLTSNNISEILNQDQIFKPPVKVLSHETDGFTVVVTDDDIINTLNKVNGNKTKAAKLLGISRVTLWRRLQALGN